MEDITGPWDIARFGTYEPERLSSDGQRRAFVNIGPRGDLSYRIGCNYSGSTARVDEAGVLREIPGDKVQTEMGCGAEREARDVAFFGFFGSSPSVTRDGERSRLDNGRTALVLERPETRRLRNAPSLAEITGRWRIDQVTLFRNGGHRGWGALFEAGPVEIAPDRLHSADCPAAARVAYSARFRFEHQGPSAPSPAQACPKLPEAQAVVASLLADSPAAERLPGGGIVLFSERYAVTLLREDEYRRRYREHLPN